MAPFWAQTGAGVGKGTAYEYFSSKEELIAKALFWIGNQHFQTVLKKIQEKTSLREQLDAIFDFVENYFMQMGQTSLFWWHSCMCRMSSYSVSYVRKHSLH